MKTYDAVVIGAGHNGLTNAAFLAKAGLDVVCVEKNDYIGGAAVSRELYDNWIYSNCSYVCSLLRPEIFRELELHRFGLQVTPYGGNVTFMENGDYFGSYHEPEAAYRERARHSRYDADAYERYAADTQRQCRLIRDFLLRTPPDPTSFHPRDITELLLLGSKVLELGEDRIYETLRFWTASVADYLGEYFETDVIKAAKSDSGIIGTALGVHSPGTAYVLLHHYMGDVDGNIGTWGYARGAMGAVSNALAGAFQAAGGELRTEAGVEKIKVVNGKAVGVGLENGEEINARTVVSAMDVKRTFLTCMDEADVNREFRKRVANFKIRGSSGKLNIALDGLPTFPALPQGSPLYHADMHFIDIDIGILYDAAPPRTLAGQPFEVAADLGIRLGREVELVVLNDAPVDLVHRVLRDGLIIAEPNKSKRIAFEVRSRNLYWDMKPLLDRYRGVRT